MTDELVPVFHPGFSRCLLPSHCHYVKGCGHPASQAAVGGRDRNPGIRQVFLVVVAASLDWKLFNSGGSQNHLKVSLSQRDYERS